jgi:hypothetical protein
MEFSIWLTFIGLYITIAIATFLPSWKAFNAQVEGVAVDKSIDVAESAFDSAPQFNEEQKARLKKHYSRIAGTLIFWKIHAKKYKLFHYYCLIWTIPSAVLIPVLTQAISNDAPLSKVFVTVVSAFTAVLLAFHRGFKIEDNYKAFRHGESEFYDLYRRLLDSHTSFNVEIDDLISQYIAETETIRRFVRNAETSNLATLDEAKSILEGKNPKRLDPNKNED